MRTHTITLLAVLLTATTVQAQELPPGVSRAIARYDQIVAKAQTDLIRTLEKEEQAATKSGNLDMALLVRDLKAKYEKDSDPAAELLQPSGDGIAQLGVRSRGLQIAPLSVGSVAFTNRSFTWIAVPAFYTGWQFIAQAGGEARGVTLYAMDDGFLYFASTALPDASVNAAPTGDLLKYNDPNLTTMMIYKVAVTKGVWTSPPNPSWHGCIVLLPPSTKILP